ncbi:MAG: glycosyltransferase family 2 protein [Blastochloris sp.]|nr:glycosyltransferase family 2 protein [Blastochloris sp.]
MTPRVRIHLCTYQRNQMLRRAMDSLLAQSYPHWICELHNDDPNDPVPDALVRDIGDPRIIACTHTKNLGATASFNLLYQGNYQEDYLTLLEDDNWWEPEFLKKMVSVMDLNPEVDLAWANMRCWHEQLDGGWTDTGTHIWNVPQGDPILLNWLQPLQITDALHSNGAMLVRNSGSTEHVIPAETPFDIVEPVRERSFRHPILFVPEVLGNYSFTLKTARSNQTQVWADSQLLLTASLFRQKQLALSEVASLWNVRRSVVPRGTHLLLLATLLSARLDLLQLCDARDVLLLLRSCLAHPLLTWRLVLVTQRYPKLWEHLCRYAQIRFSEQGKSSSIFQVTNKHSPFHIR